MDYVWQYEEVSVLLVSILISLTAFYLNHSYGHPDEYYQGPEIAHRIYYGYGHRTWEWEKGIRGYFHPLILTVGYRFAEIVFPGDEWILVLSPWFLTTFVSCVGSFFVYKLAKKLYGQRVGLISYAIYITTPSFLYYAPRTFSNVLEMGLLPIALYFWPHPSMGAFEFKLIRSMIISTLFFGASCAIRPTAALNFIPLIVHIMWINRKCLLSLTIILASIGSITIIYLILSLIIDNLYYGRFLFAPLEFYRFNINESASAYFGKESFLDLTIAYISLVGAPCILVLFFYALTPKHSEVFYNVVMYYMVHALFVTHKEQRFLLPIVPTSSIMAGYVVSKQLSRSGKSLSVKYINLGKLIKVAFLVSCILSILISGYVSRFNNTHHIELAKFIHHDVRIHGQRTGNYKDYNVFFLSDCYYFPAQSFIHKHINIGLLSCKPDLSYGEDSKYIDEGAQFRNAVNFTSFANAHICQRPSVPNKPTILGITNYINMGIPNTNPFHSCYINLPSVVALASDSTRVQYIRSFLTKNGYVEVFSTKPSHFNQVLSYLLNSNAEIAFLYKHVSILSDSHS